MRGVQPWQWRLQRKWEKKGVAAPADLGGGLDGPHALTVRTTAAAATQQRRTCS